MTSTEKDGRESGQPVAAAVSSDLAPTAQYPEYVRGSAAPTPPRPPVVEAVEPVIEPVAVRPRPRRRWSLLFGFLVSAVVVLAMVGFGLRAAGAWPSWRNPFVTETTDESGPVLLRSIEDLQRFVAAEGDFEVIVDLQENRRFIPDAIFNDRTLFVGAGTVEAYVDFTGLGQDAIVESPDRTSVTVNLPAPQLSKPNIDHDRSHVFAEQRGLANRVGDLFGGDLNRQQELYQLAEQKITEAAVESELRERAENNTRAMLESMLHSLGYQSVTVDFAQP